jgi:flagellar biosynthesis/type III secretory pathway protein FliH
MSVNSENLQIKKLPVGYVIKARDLDAALELHDRQLQFEEAKAEFAKDCREIAVEAQIKGYEHAIEKTLDGVVDYIDELEILQKKRHEKLLPLVSDVLGDVVSEIVGSVTTEDVVKGLANQHLSRIMSKFDVELTVDPSILEAVQGTVGELAETYGRSVEVTADENLDKGRIVVRTPEGYFDLGIARQTEIARKFIARQLTESLLAED